jgi:pentatricopeptide repeat protein
MHVYLLTVRLRGCATSSLITSAVTKNSSCAQSIFESMSAQNLVVASESISQLRLQGRVTSVAALNAVLSAYAERGDVDRAMTLMGEFPHFNVEPDADSFSFALEALGKHLSRSPHPSRPMIESCLDSVTFLLNSMEDKGIAPTPHVIRHYVELLCKAKDAETASSVVRAIMKVDGLVNNMILYRVAKANAEVGRFDIAREMAAYANVPMPFLARKINRMEIAVQLHKKKGPS